MGYKDGSHRNANFHGFPFRHLQKFENENRNMIYQLLLKGDFNTLWNKVFKRELVDWDVDYSQYMNVKVSTDIFQIIPIVSNANKMVYLDEPYYY